jgi:hypothetical protein
MASLPALLLKLLLPLKPTIDERGAIPAGFTPQQITVHCHS